MGPETPEVGSAGVVGWEGSGATPESVIAGAERDLDIGEHRARHLVPSMLEDVDLVIAMAAEHRSAVAAMAPAVAPRAFTLKELTRLAEALPPSRGRDRAALGMRVAAADELRRGGFEGSPLDEDVDDPLGMPLETYRAVAWEIDGWTERLADALVGPVTTRPGADETAGEG
jgi:protein-tyrosine phosphatase